jgi:predicted Zn-dependent protease
MFLKQISLAAVSALLLLSFTESSFAKSSEQPQIKRYGSARDMNALKAARAKYLEMVPHLQGTSQVLPPWKYPEMIRPSVSKPVPSLMPPHTVTSSSIPRNQKGHMQVAGDYLNDMVNAGVKRWSGSRFPLRVFIESGRGVPGYKPEHAQMMVSSLNEWSSVTNKTLSWVPTNDSSDADIIISFAHQPPDVPDGAETGETRTSTAPDGQGGQVITRAWVTILTMMHGAPISDDEVKKTCLHELGHAYGLSHSSTGSDIMHWQSSFSQQPALTSRDGATIRRLYNL